METPNGPDGRRTVQREQRKGLRDTHTLGGVGTQSLELEKVSMAELVRLSKPTCAEISEGTRSKVLAEVARRTKPADPEDTDECVM